MKFIIRDWKSTTFVKKSLEKRVKKPKKQLSYNFFLKRRLFLYQSRKILLKHQNFIHRYHDFSRGYTYDFSLDPLYSQAYFQQRALSQKHNHSQPICQSFIPQLAIQYSTSTNQLLQQRKKLGNIIFFRDLPVRYHVKISMIQKITPRNQSFYYEKPDNTVNSPRIVHKRFVLVHTPYLLAHLQFIQHI